MVSRGKTLWDWLQLLVVPAILIAVVSLWNSSQATRDNHRADQQRQDTTLDDYLKQMSNLMLHERLLATPKPFAVMEVADTITASTLPRLDGARKGEVLQFLTKAGLVYPDRDHFALTRLDLADAYLVDAGLMNADLDSDDLERANLKGAYLKGASLIDADLAGANLNGAYLSGAVLEYAKLDGADLDGAELQFADFGVAKLRNAHLDGADLSYSKLGGADFQHAHITGADLSYANLRFAKNLDLGRFITDLSQHQKKAFLDSEKAFLDSLSRKKKLASFNLSPEKLATFRRQAAGG